MRWLLVFAVACSSSSSEVVIDLSSEAEVTRAFTAPATVTITGGAGQIVEAYAPGLWFVPAPVDGDVVLDVPGDGEVTMTAWARGPHLAPVSRDRSLAWFDPQILDGDVSFARVMAVLGGGRALDTWFRAFAAGPGAGRATFAQFLDEIVAAQGADPAQWNLAALPFRVTGVHNRVDLAAGDPCGELRVSIASTHPTFSPVHFIFLFRQPPRSDDVTPDGAVHCRGTARMWARLTALDATAFRAAATELLATSLVRERFLLAESVELSLSPWQWRQWSFSDAGAVANPPLFQTLDVARVNAPGATRDAFLAAVAANEAAIAARTWVIPAQFRSPVAEVQPNSKATLPDVGALSPALPRALGMIGCPRCHTDDADFIQTGVDRKPSPFYDKELDARAGRLDALGRGESPPAPPFGPLQSL